MSANLVNTTRATGSGAPNDMIAKRNARIGIGSCSIIPALITAPEPFTASGDLIGAEGRSCAISRRVVASKSRNGARIVGLRFSMIVDDGVFRHQHGLEIKKFALN
ncbi:hypothetical protein [Tardiphaga sp. 42S5]|uniref:hypothetical protein n=1 Tax=Tardiphaga sp. 42S5 TaxID=1404799 RepID=UPI002A5A441D|nr:hypothetical protein [Tardiphaga sp. 42S5]WPO43613.1 hypothetical protein SFY93_10870 [Tardiphaga sp. 42S5]